MCTSRPSVLVCKKTLKIADSGGPFLMKGIYTLPVQLQKPVTQKTPEKTRNICSRDGVRAGRGSPCTILLLPFSVAASSPSLTQLAPSNVRSLTLNPGRLQKYMPFATGGACVENNQPNHLRPNSTATPRPDHHHHHHNRHRGRSMYIVQVSGDGGGGWVGVVVWW